MWPLFLPSISEMPVPDLVQRETKQLLPNLGAAAILTLLWQAFSQGMREKLVSKWGCWKELEYLATDVLVLALPKTVLSLNEISPLSREKVLVHKLCFWEDLLYLKSPDCILHLSTVVHVEHTMCLYLCVCVYIHTHTYMCLYAHACTWIHINRV